MFPRKWVVLESFWRSLKIVINIHRIYNIHIYIRSVLLQGMELVGNRNFFFKKCYLYVCTEFLNFNR